MSSQKTVVLDIGSGASLPTKKEAEKVVSMVASLNSRRHRVILKPQLFKNIPPNKELSHEVYEHLVALCQAEGLELAASVFDEASLHVALTYGVAHIKIACRPDLYWLAGKVPREVPVHVSWDCRGQEPTLPKVDVRLACVPSYPAEWTDYNQDSRYMESGEWSAISDHAVGLTLWEKCDPEVWEKHFVLEPNNPDNPDSMGGFAMDPDQLREALR